MWDFASGAAPAAIIPPSPSAAAVAAIMKRHIASILDPVDIARAGVLAQATNFARSLSGDEIDWSREPLSGRERAIRARFLAGARDGGSSGGMARADLHLMAFELLSEGMALATDLRDALVESERRIENVCDVERREQYRAIGRSLDDESAA
jgi:hypothetical protein